MMYIHTQHFFDSHDKAKLFYQHWSATSGCTIKKAVVLLHRGHEHSGRMAHLVDELNLPDCDFFAWDARGHGESAGLRGDSPSFGCSVKDLQSFVLHIQQKHAIQPENMVMVAQSVGAVLAATWVHDYAPNIRALCLVAPAFKIKLYVPFARAGLRCLHAVKGNFFINSYVKAGLLTHDKARARSYDTDPAIAKAISVRMLLGLYDAADRVVADAQAIHVPTQLLISGADYVVYTKPQIEFFKNLSHPLKELHVLDGFYHDTLGEENRHLATQKIHRFISQSFEMLPQPLDLIHADQIGQSCSMAEKYSEALPQKSFANVYWSFTQYNLRLGSYISDGLKLGQKTGFDSGSTLDYVYKNTPESRHWLGRVIDRQYLNAVGWKGIRVRKTHIEMLLQQVITRLKAQKQPVNIVDIAAGHGRYIIEAIEKLEYRPDHVLLRDYSPLNVNQGQKLIQSKALERVVDFEQGDAFDKNSLADIKANKTVAVVSGLYELFSDNHLVKQSLEGLAKVIVSEGYLIYTGQIWHPQQEFIARALTSHREGNAWVMRLRTQAEMDQLVAAAGFVKIDQCIDEFGIFTVSLAQRKEVKHG
ncbi:Lysophospholipase, alpha-beta hydrolase superfamily [Acinetobacter boissieri]|uniref:Lysophospholipase, alpha-beta hydrolase superfamily n=2 Tax=Acinetobacter boissieri TaxID=1219383 RepID=A0A1G6H6F8_9GAMM|nr:Lysophospholipase, alpha-beta hydrolase superfamily [Acinetobacter boissieri]